MNESSCTRQRPDGVYEFDKELNNTMRDLSRNSKQHLKHVLKAIEPVIELAFRRGVDCGKGK